jgi:hypothetical protein
MKSISRSLPLRSFAPLFPFPTNTFCSSSTLHLTYNHRHLSTTMPPPPKRKWNRPRPSGAATNAPATQQSPAAQQPKRPRVNDGALQNEGGPIDVKAMYSTSAGNAEAKRFSEMAGKLDNTLLQGLEKMGFEYVHSWLSPPTQLTCPDTCRLSSRRC